MSITAITRDFNSVPNIVRIISTNTIAQCAAANYVSEQQDNIDALNSGTWEWLESDLILVSASDGHALFEFDGDDFTTFVALPAGNGEVTLPVTDGDFTVFDGTLGGLKDAGYSASDPAKTKVVMANAAVVSGQLAVFTDTAGTIDDTANAALAGNLTLGGYYIASSANALTAHAGGGQGSALQLAKQINRVTTVASAGDSVKLPVSVAGMAVTVINAAAANAMDVFPATGEVINALAANTAISVLADTAITFYCAVAGTWNSILTA